MSDSDSSTSSDNDIDDLDTRIAKYSNIESKPIAPDDEFTSSDDSDDDKEDEEEDENSDSDDESEEDDTAQAESFNVSVRVRPLFSKEKMLKYKNIIRVNDDKYVTLKNPEVLNKNDYLSMKRDRQKRFCFDNVFDSNIPTAFVYKKTVRRVIKSIMEGYNATVFAYGATGSGKTYTMLGSDTEPGVMVHTLRDLFKIKDKQSQQFTFRIVISFLEIYNENIRDLLVSNRGGGGRKKKRKYLDLRETPKKGVIIAGITFKPANDVAEVMELLSLGNKRRTVESTAANAVSSRSHAVLQVYVERKSTDIMNRDIRCGKLNLIDLAGSEKGSVVKSGQKSRMTEGANINKSLLALSKCINALVDKKKFIPFRDSKLTRLLQDALGGNCKTVMICNISPSSFTWDDSHNTLKYADRAKNIRIKKAEINKMKNDNKNDLNIVIESLKSQVNQLKTQLTVKEQEKKILRRKSKMIVKQQKQQLKQRDTSLGLLSERDLQLLSIARDKLKEKMQSLEDLHRRLADLNEEETNLIAQEISMKQMLQFSMNNELHQNYKRLIGRLSDIKLDKMEIERKIKLIANGTDNDLQGLLQRSNSKHLHTMIQKENELFRAQIDNKTTHLNMSFMENKYMNQENEITKLQQQNLKKHEDFQKMQQQLQLIKQSKEEQERALQEHMSFYKSKHEQETQDKEEKFMQQINELKQQFIEQETRKQNEQQEKEEELNKQLAFYQSKYEEESKQNEVKFQQQLEDLKLKLMEKEQQKEKELKEKEKALKEQEELQKAANNAPKRKQNIKPSEIPYLKWDRDDVYFWIIDVLSIDEKYAKLIYDEGFDGEAIADIREEDLKEIGVSAMGVRRKIARNIDLLQQKDRLLHNPQSTLADSVAWNSMYKGIPPSDNYKQRTPSYTGSVFSDMTSVSQIDAQRQMRMMQDQLKNDPTNAENPAFMMQMMRMFASSQQLLPQLPNDNNMDYNQRVSVPAQMQPAVPEEEEVFIDEDEKQQIEHQQVAKPAMIREITDEMEEKAELPLTETAGGPNEMMPGEITPMQMHIDGQHNNGIDDDEVSVKLMKAKQQEAKKAVHALANTLRVSLNKKQMEQTLVVRAAADGTNMDDLPLTPGYKADDYDIRFGVDDDEDSDEDLPFDYDENWMFEDRDKSFNVILLSPYKSLRKSFLKFCFEPQVIKDRKRTLSYKRYEKVMKCGDSEFIFRVLECYESNYIPDLFDNQCVESIFMIFPFAITADNALDKETQFMQDLDTWMLSSGHWHAFWSKCIRMLDGSLSFKKHTFKSKQQYFDSNEARKRALNDLFDQFNVENVYKSQQLKWLNIETTRKTKLKIKEKQRKYKFKWPNIPNINGDNDEKQDWRTPLTLKVFNALNEPNKSYFLTAALYSPQRNLIAPEFLSTAQSAARNGAYADNNNNNNNNDDDDDYNNEDDVELAIEKKEKKKKKKKKKRDKKKTNASVINLNVMKDMRIDEDIEEDGDDLELSMDGNETMRMKRDEIIANDEEEDMDISDDEVALAAPAADDEDYNDLNLLMDSDTMKINRNDFDFNTAAAAAADDHDANTDTMKINRSELDKSKSYELAQAQTENVLDSPAILDDSGAAPILASAPQIIQDDDINDEYQLQANIAQPQPQQENDDEALQKQLMQDAFAKFQEKRNTLTADGAQDDDEAQYAVIPMMDDVDQDQNDDYNEMEYKPVPPSGPPPPQYNDYGGYQISAPPTNNNRNNNLLSTDDEGDVTPVDDDVIDDFGGFPEIDKKPQEIQKPQAEFDPKRRESKALHTYEPSWAINNKLHNQFSYYQAPPTVNYFDSVYSSNPINAIASASPYVGSFRASIYGAADDSDDDLEEELDFRKTKQQQKTNHEKKFSQRYVTANRNQSIMRYQDIFEQSTNLQKRVSDKMFAVAANKNKRMSDNNNNMGGIEETDDFAPVLLAADAPIYGQEKRVSKYMQTSSKNIKSSTRKSTYEQQRDYKHQAKKSYNDEYANYSAPVEEAQSVSSAHSYSGQRQFGASAKGNRKKKGGTLKKLWKWGK